MAVVTSAMITITTSLFRVLWFSCHERATLTP